MDLSAIENGARAYLTRRETDPRLYATNFRQTLIFLILEDAPPQIVPLAWALSATKPGWQNTTSSMNSGNARHIAEAAGLTPIEAGHPLHDTLWQVAREECLRATGAELPPNRQKFTEHYGRPRSPADNSYYILRPQADAAVLPSEAAAEPGFEGACRQVTSNRYERKASPRRACIQHAKTQNGGDLCCAACDMSFAKTYGPTGDGFIHIHHLDPLGNRQKAHLVDPTRDLVPVCPNCHAMIHRGGANRPIQELRALMTRATSSQP